MFLLPDQQLERCDRVMQQRIKSHIHTTLAACTLVRSHNPGEPVPSSEFLAKVRNGQVPFEPFRVPGVWGTTWGTACVRGERPHRHRRRSRAEKSNSW